MQFQQHMTTTFAIVEPAGSAKLAAFAPDREDCLQGTWSQSDGEPDWQQRSISLPARRSDWGCGASLAWLPNDQGGPEGGRSVASADPHHERGTSQLGCVTRHNCRMKTDDLARAGPLKTPEARVGASSLPSWRALPAPPGQDFHIQLTDQVLVCQ